MSNIARIFERHQLFITDYYEISSSFSNTKKYLLTSGDKKYLLKIYPLAKFERLQQQQVFLKQHQKNHVHCQTPIFCDTFEREQLCYFIFNYLSELR
jgi:Ser/Thr protein kinase RdoA (MazF antagonist)